MFKKSRRPTLLTTLKKIYSEERLRKVFRKFEEFTMIREEEYIRNLQLAKRVAHLDGAVVECGVWRGGMIAGIASIFSGPKKYYLFDSFEGLPPVKEIDGEEAAKWQAAKDSPGYFDNCTAEMIFAQTAMKMALNTSSEAIYIKGWFNETLPHNGIERIALLRLDGDWYDSTMACLQHLYPKVMPGGMIMIDDYYAWEGCAKAVHDYLSANNRHERICQFNNHTAYIIKDEKIK